MTPAPYGSGCFADWLAMEDALIRLNLAKSIGDFLNLRASAENERTRRLELASAAALCGYEPSDETPLVEWVEARLRTFRNQIRKAS